MSLCSGMMALPVQGKHTQAGGAAIRGMHLTQFQLKQGLIYVQNWMAPTMDKTEYLCSQNSIHLYSF